jgi:hypothetical protein
VVADQWATEGAGASGAEGLPGEEESITTPAHVGRGITKTKWNERLAWAKARCHGKRYYLLARAPKDRPGAKEHCHPVPRSSFGSIGPSLSSEGLASRRRQMLVVPEPRPVTDPGAPF